MSLNELNYSTEIAAAMLKKQTAAALLEARQLIVEGAVSIAQGAISKLQEDSNLSMTNAVKVKVRIS